MPEILVVDHPKVAAWPNYATMKARQQSHYVEFQVALRTTYATDAHATQYSLPAIPRRLDGGVLAESPKELLGRLQAKAFASAANRRGRKVDTSELVQEQVAAKRLEAFAREAPLGVPMVCVMFDVDLKPVDEDWRAWARDCARLLFRTHPGFFAETKNGARICYALAEPFYVKTKDDAARWMATYQGWLRYISRLCGLAIIGHDDANRGLDPACSDWTRLVRLPRATRDGAADPEDRPLWGDVEPWAPNLKPSDEAAVARRLAAARDDLATRGERGETGVFMVALEARGHLFGAAPNGGRICRCPNFAEHGDGRDGSESSCAVYPREGTVWGYISCFHAHCLGRESPGGWIHLFSEEEIAAARAAMGLGDDAGESQKEIEWQTQFLKK